MPKNNLHVLMTPEQRCESIAAILARGVLRAVRARRCEEALAVPTPTHDPPEVSSPSESFPPSQVPLELSTETRLSVAIGPGG